MRIGVRGSGGRGRAAASGSIRTHPDPSGSIRIHPDPSASFRIHPDSSGSVRTHPDPSGPQTAPSSSSGGSPLICDQTGDRQATARRRKGRQATANSSNRQATANSSNRQATANSSILEFCDSLLTCASNGGPPSDRKAGRTHARTDGRTLSQRRIPFQRTQEKNTPFGAPPLTPIIFIICYKMFL